MITGIKTSMNQYYYNKEAVSKENEVSFEKKTKKDYKKVVEEYKKKHPQSASNVDEQVQAGKDYIRKCGADDIPRSEMTMEQYKAFIKNLMNGVPFDISQRNDTEQWSITEEGWEQMKNDRDYEAWILGYTIQNRSVHFPFTTSRYCIEKFGASIEEHLGQAYPKEEHSKKANDKEESWWQKRHKRIKQLAKERNEIALAKARYLNELQQQGLSEDEIQVEWFRQKSLISNKLSLFKNNAI